MSEVIGSHIYLTPWNVPNSSKFCVKSRVPGFNDEHTTRKGFKDTIGIKFF